jgi:hypothetical protein
MTDLIEKIKSTAGVNDEQAIKAIEVIKNYTKEKFPMFAGAIDNLFEKYGPEEKDPLD